MTYALGLTGGIGSGKTTVSQLFGKRGVPIVDADAIVHELQAPGAPALAELAEAFGAEILTPDGALDRARLADIVFRDPEARRRLGLIIHPKVGLEMRNRVDAAREANEPLVIADIPLLLEGQREGRDTAAALGLDGILVVWVSPEVQLERARARDGFSREEAQRRIDAQMPIDEKRALADFVIDNSGSVEETDRQVEALYRRLVGG